MDLSIIIPVYNEEKNVKALYWELSRVLSGLSGTKYEILYIDDGSTDGTVKDILEVAQRDASVHLISLRRRFGLSAALSAGFDKAQGKVIISMDGDMQHDPEFIVALCDELNKGFDLVCGYRKVRVYKSVIRYWISISANYAGRLLFGVDVHDFSTTFRAYRSDAVKRFLIFDGAHRFIPILAKKNNLKVSEIIVTYRSRLSGISKVAVVSRLFKVIKDAVLIRIGLSPYFKKVKYEIQYTG